MDPSLSRALREIRFPSDAVTRAGFFFLRSSTTHKIQIHQPMCIHSACGVRESAAADAKQGEVKSCSTQELPVFVITPNIPTQFVHTSRLRSLRSPHPTHHHHSRHATRQAESRRRIERREDDVMRALLFFLLSFARGEWLSFTRHGCLLFFLLASCRRQRTSTAESSGIHWISRALRIGAPH